MKYMGVNDKYELSVVPIEETELFYSAQSQVRDQETGCIGHMRQDYGRDDKGFWTSWTDHCPEFKTQAFKDEFDDVINTLKKSVLKDLRAMTAYCNERPQAKLKDMHDYNYGFKITTDMHVYYLRCCTLQNDYNLYAYAYDRDRLEKCFAPLAYTEITAELKSKLEKVAEFVLETAARETITGSHLIYPDDIPEEIISPALYNIHSDTIEDILNEYDAVADIAILPDGVIDLNLFWAYCPNYEPLPEEAVDYPGGYSYFENRTILDPLKSKRVPAIDSQPFDDVETKPSLMSRLAENKEKAARHGQAEHHKTKNQEAVL